MLEGLIKNQSPVLIYPALHEFSVSWFTLTITKEEGTIHFPVSTSTDGFSA